MTHSKNRRIFLLVAAFMAVVLAAYGYQASLISNSHLISPEDLVKVLQSSKLAPPLVISVGPHMLYAQAHITGAEYFGPGSDLNGLQRLRARVESLPRNKFIVIYCGCCPWNHCPNAKPADDALREMGFGNVKVLYVAENFGVNWVDKGYPTTRGE